MRAAIAIGSNIGERLTHLQEAVDQLASLGEVIAVSAIYETDPVGGPEQQDFLNAVVVLETELDPVALLNAGHLIEQNAHRERIEHWGPRTLDVDVLAFDQQVINNAEITLPHPRAHERGFVLVPWNDVDPDFNLVGYGRISELVTRVDISGVRLSTNSHLTFTRGNHA